MDEMRAEMVDVAGEIGVKWTKRRLNTCLKQCTVPEDRRTGLIVPIWKRKVDAQDPGKYRGITLLSHIIKLLEMILDKRLRDRVEPELGEEQLGFRKGRGTTDGMFSLRQLVEKRSEKQGQMALAFVDLEKAFDTVPRRMAMTTLRWMGAPESEVKMIEAMYENTKARVVVGSGMSNEFQVNIGLRQGSALSPLLFMLVIIIIIIIIIIRQPLCPVVGLRPQHAVSKLPCLVLSSAISCRSSICPGRLSIAWLVSLVVFSCHMVSNW